MKAIVRREYGPPDVLKMEDVDKPLPKENEVLVKIHATGLNASDFELLTGTPLYGRIWGLFTPSITVLGSDIAGTVEAVGANVTKFQLGDEVFGDIFESWGGLAEWVCAPQSMLRSKPKGMTFEQAAATPQSATIALQGLRDKGRIQAGQTVLINGAGGGGGTFAVQFAKAVGAQVTAVDRGEKLELLRSLGADEVIDYTKVDFTRNGRCYDLILDLVGHHSIWAFKRALAPTGRYLMVGGSVSLLFQVLLLGSVVSLITRKKMGLLAIKTNEGLEYAEELFASGDAKPIIDRTFPLAEVPQALRRLGEGRTLGKLVVTMEPVSFRSD